MIVNLEAVKEVLSDSSRRVPYNYTLLDVVEELEAARLLIKTQEKHEKYLHRYNALVSGASEEIASVDEAGDLLATATAQLLAARQRYQRVVDGEH